MSVTPRRRLPAVALLCALALPAQPSRAQASSPDATLLAANEMDTLVARVALYPDPLLALVLQASTLPVEVVQAVRFLDRRAGTPSLEPDPGWDTSIVGLLNYPTVLRMMDDDLGWTDRLGGAVLDRLPEVQASVQQIRAELQAGGVLASNDKQTVVVDDETIRIEPAKPDVIYVPVYQPVPEPAPARPAVVPVAATAPAPATQAHAPAPGAYAAPYPPTYAAPGAYPAAYPAPVTYSVPPVTYSDPYPSFWTPTAAFVGGGVVGGLLGYAIGSDNDNNDNKNNNNGKSSNNNSNTIEINVPDDVSWGGGGSSSGRGGINIEDSTIVVGGNRANVARQTSLAQSELRARQAKAAAVTPQQRAQARAQLPASPAGAPAAQASLTSRQVSTRQSPVPAGGAEPPPATRQAQARVGDRPDTGKGGLAGGPEPQRQARGEADRGARSLAAAQRATPPTQQAAPPKRPQASTAKPPATAAKQPAAPRAAAAADRPAPSRPQPTQKAQGTPAAQDTKAQRGADRGPVERAADRGARSLAPVRQQ